jgi:Ca2+-binding EF-hand superfamily protein
MNLVGGECPNTEDITDLFNLLDINGDECIDRKELTSLLMVFFKLLQEKDIDVEIEE